MQFNWSTFVLEIINFVVLVWILKHFLYRPVLSLLEKRREKIEQSLSAATERHCNERNTVARLVRRKAIGGLAET